MYEHQDCSFHIGSTNAHQAAAGQTNESTSTDRDTVATVNNICNSTISQEARLSHLLRSSYVRSSGQKNAVFIPVDKIDAFICPPNVRRQLAFSTILDSAAIDERVSHMCGPRDSRENRRKIFAILVLVEMETEITGFIAANICDYDLPLELQYHSHGSPSSQSLVLERTGHQPGFVGNWKDSAKELFDRYQWIVNSPCLLIGRGRKVLHYDLAHQTILPFTKGGESQGSRNGGFGTVSRVEIHSAHHNFKQVNNLPVIFLKLKPLSFYSRLFR